MIAPVLDQTLETLELMAKAEETVERLYGTCATVWRENGDFWQGLAGEEKCHAGILRTMASILADNPGLFQPGRPFSPGALKTFISGIEYQIESLKRPAVQELNAMHVALDIEQAFIEARFAEVVKTDDRHFQDLANEIVRETAVHRRLVEKKIAEQHSAGIGR